MLLLWKNKGEDHSSPKAGKFPAPTPIEDYEMHGEFSRPTLPTDEYSGIATEELLGRPTPNVSYSLERNDAPDLSEEFAARDSDLEAGLKKEMEITGRVIQRPTFGKISQGFVYQRVPHITLKAIANNSEIDTIWEKYEAESERLRKELGEVTGSSAVAGRSPYQEWEVPFEVPEGWSDEAKKLHGAFMEMKRKRQKEIDDSIARTAETEYLYDKPYEDKKRVRVAGPFTVESIAPVRSLVSEADGTLSDPAVKLAERMRE